jgi:hypothetical protein
VHELLGAAIEYTLRVVTPALPVDQVVTGGDRALVRQVLEDPRLRTVALVPRGPHLDMPDPRRDTIQRLPELLTTVRIDLIDP